MNINESEVNKRAIDVGIFGNLLGWPFVGLFIIFLTSLKRLNLNNCLLLIVFFVYFLILFLLEIIEGSRANLLSYINAFITISTLYLFQEKNIPKIKCYLVKLAIFSVPVSLFVSVLFASGLEDLGVRTNEVLGISRLTFFFSEPSHYAVFLGFNLINAKSLNASRWELLIISAGLLLTWSLSGYFIFFILFAIYRSDGNYIKLISSSLLIFTFLFLLWEFYLDGSGLWIEKKLNTLLVVLNGGNDLNSSMVRYLSTIVIFDYFYYSFGELSFFFGEGISGYAFWVENYYLNNYGISRSGELFNYLAVLLVSGGVVGFLLYFYSMFRVLRFDKISKDKFLLSALALSLFSGYLYGFIAVLYWFLIFSFSYNDES